MLRNLIPFVVVALFAGCALLGAGPDACDPGYVTVKLQAMALECRAKRLRECRGVGPDAFADNPALCPAVRNCYADMDRVAAECTQ